MDILKVIFLGMVQGLTEFLPISSTGHLILVEKFFHITSSLSFDAFMHLGSFLAILVYFWKELKEIWGYKWLVFIAILPGGIAGLLLEHIVDTYLRTPQMVAFFLFVMSIPMILGEKFGKKTKDIKELGIKEAGFIGFAQALALLPGTSRSGITISAGLLTGLKREVSAKFSFIAGAPLILGAGLYEGIKLLKHHTISYDLAFTGFLSAAVWSFIAIAVLIPFLKKHTLYSFVIYRIALAGLIFLLLL